MTQKILIKKLAEVTAAIGTVKKTGYNSFQKYEYLREQDLMDAIREELTKRNIFISTSVEETCTVGEIATVKTKHIFHCGDSGETLEVFGAGAGHDKLDKHIFKAQTGSMKYMLMKNFFVGTNDDPENDNKEEAAKPVATKPIPKLEIKPETKKPSFNNSFKPKVEF